jgi:hypothetical protein
MPNCSESLGFGRATRCVVCDGRFGSKKCVDRFRACRASACNWLGRLEIAFDQLPENRVRTL